MSHQLQNPKTKETQRKKFKINCSDCGIEMIIFYSTYRGIKRGERKNLPLCKRCLSKVNHNIFVKGHNLGIRFGRDKIVSGKNHWNWKGGITAEEHKIRTSIDFQIWRHAVFTRDNWTCQKTGIKGGILHAHHIKNFSQYPELRLAIDNGITLSKESHQEFHHLYGIKNNNAEQLIEFLNKK